MRSIGLIGCVVAGLFAGSLNAQVYQLPTPAPQVTAANMSWQVNGEPLFFAGDFYSPTGPTVFFDGFIMVRTGTFQGVPLYADTTIEPYSIVYVPIGRNVMRPYERRRTGELAGTTGSRPPAFPTPPASAQATPGIEPEVTPEVGQAVATGGSFPRSTRAPSSAPVRRATQGRLPVSDAIRSSSVQNSVWIEFNNMRWHLAGPAVPYDADRFVQIGTQHEWPVYRAKGDAGMRIFVPAVEDGPLTPYRRD